MKKVLALTILGLLLVAGNVMALPANTNGYEWVDAPYWTLTDLTTLESGESTFLLTVESAAYESEFGLFIANEDGTAVQDTFTVFGASEEPSLDPLSQQSIYFRVDAGGNWSISDDKDAAVWTDWDSMFGFYFGVDADDDGSTDYTFYSDSSLNTMDKDVQHIAMEWDGSKVNIYLEDLLAENADWDWDDMKVNGTDLAPVPEPGTVLLLGAGLLGLIGLGRKRIKK